MSPTGGVIGEEESMEQEGHSVRVRTSHDVSTLARGRRLELGWTQHQLAERAGVSRKWVSDFERGRTGPDLATVLRVLDVLDVALDAGTGPVSPPDAPGALDLDAVLDRYLRP